jgi:hypothetical protein
MPTQRFVLHDNTGSLVVDYLSTWKGRQEKFSSSKAHPELDWILAGFEL